MILTDADVQRLNDKACMNNFGRHGEWDELNEDGKAWARELARLAHEQGCRDTVAGAIGAAGRLEQLLPGVPPGTLHSEIAADEIERLRAELVTERASREDLEQAAELLRRCERPGTAPRHRFELQAIHAEMSAWWERDQASATTSPTSPGKLAVPSDIFTGICERCGKPEGTGDECILCENRRLKELLAWAQTELNSMVDAMAYDRDAGLRADDIARALREKMEALET